MWALSSRYLVASSIAVDGGDGSVVGVEATDNGTAGISIASDDNSVHGSVISGNSDFGIIAFDAVTDNRIDGNRALDNGTVNLFDENPNCDSNAWDGNHFERRQPTLNPLRAHGPAPIPAGLGPSTALLVDLPPA